MEDIEISSQASLATLFHSFPLGRRILQSSLVTPHSCGQTKNPTQNGACQYAMILKCDEYAMLSNYKLLGHKNRIKPEIFDILLTRKHLTLNRHMYTSPHYLQGSIHPKWFSPMLFVRQISENFESFVLTRQGADDVRVTRIGDRQAAHTYSRLVRWIFSLNTFDWNLWKK